MADFALLNSPKLISRKIWVIEKSWNFHTVWKFQDFSVLHALHVISRKIWEQRNFNIVILQLFETRILSEPILAQIICKVLRQQFLELMKFNFFFASWVLHCNTFETYKGWAHLRFGPVASPSLFKKDLKMVIKEKKGRHRGCVIHFFVILEGYLWILLSYIILIFGLCYVDITLLPWISKIIAFSIRSLKSILESICQSTVKFQKWWFSQCEHFIIFLS